MFILAILFDTANRNLLLGFVPESLGLLLFGVLLISFAASLRWLFKRSEEISKEGFSAEARSVSEKI